MPSDARLLPYRSNIPYLSNYSFATIDPDFLHAARKQEGIIIGGVNYGQEVAEACSIGSSYLGIRLYGKIFARIHRSI